MHRNWTVLWIMLVLFSWLIAPVGSVRAQDANPDCPPYEPGLLSEKELLRSFPLECVQAYKESARPLNSAAGAQDVQPMAVGGPDGFGYTFNDSVPYTWISAATNSGLTGDDEFTGPINIGFNFPFYGVAQSQLYFSTNGLITFDAGSSEWASYDIEIGNDLSPSNMIAPFWDNLLVGSPYNGGGIYYSQGGTAPNHYFVVEWRNVEQWYTPDLFSFQAILHENGDIVFQYQSTPNLGLARMGIEDSLGYDVLKYEPDSWSPLVGKSIRFCYPEPAAYLQVAPALSAGGFAPISGHKDFSIIITNSGRMGADTYDLTVSSVWAVTLYASNGITPLTDTDSDTVIDTGPVPPGASTTVIARFSTPGAAHIGDNNTGRVNIRSSLDSFKVRVIELSMSVPANFVNVFQNEADGAMSFMTVGSDSTSNYKATADNYLGYANAVTKLTNGNYFYAWHSFYETESRYWADIEYALIGWNGNIVFPLTKLTDNSSAALYVEEDQHPSIAVAPNGTVGVVWSRYLHNGPTDQFNYNIYFATLDSSGNLLTGPTNISNNTIWGTPGDLNTPRFYSPRIAASDDNRFVIGWVDNRSSLTDTLYTIRSSTGTSIVPPTTLIDDRSGTRIFINSLVGGKVIMTWAAADGVRYAVINSDGTISKPVTMLRSYGAMMGPDAVQLPNGNVAVAWGLGVDDEVELAILNSSHNLVQGPTTAYYPNPTTSGPYGLSLTTDAASHVIITGNISNTLFYALGNSSGIFLTEPMIYKTSGKYIYSSTNGQGNAPYEEGSSTEGPDTTGVFRPSNGALYLKNSNTTGFADVQINYGIGGDYPVVGDWDGNGTSTIGIYRNGSFYLRNSNTIGFADVVFPFGAPGDQPIAGDWDGDGVDTVGIYRQGTFFMRNSNSAGTPDMVFGLGIPGDVGIAGDWNGDGMDTTGAFRPSNGALYLKNQNVTGFADIQINYGIGGDKPVTGDWNNDGVDTIGVYRNGQFYLRNSNTIGFADLVFALGIPGDHPIAGNWDGLP